MSCSRPCQQSRLLLVVPAAAAKPKPTAAAKPVDYYQHAAALTKANAEVRAAMAPRSGAVQPKPKDELLAATQERRSREERKNQPPPESKYDDLDDLDAMQSLDIQSIVWADAKEAASIALAKRLQAEDYKQVQNDHALAYVTQAKYVAKAERELAGAECARRLAGQR
jgi:hypothetical protein